MKTFEERYTAWIDGRLSEAECVAFERELPDLAAAERDRAHLQGLGEFLRRHSNAPSLANADFFCHQVSERIRAEQLVPQAKEKEGGWSFWSLPNLAWAFACLVLAGAALFFAITPSSPQIPGIVSSTKPGESTLPITAVHVASTDAPAADVYDASIIEATPVEPGVSASVYSQAENVTVLWLDGLDYLPASYTLQ